MTIPLQVRVGDRVTVRRQRWTVVEVRPFDECALVTAVGVGTTNASIERTFIAPFDVFEPLERAGRIRVVRPVRWRRLCRELIAVDGPAGSLRTAAQAQIDLLPHQLEPALAIVSGAGSRLLIADDVGLGKTIQAGLIVSELQARGAANRVLVLTPAGLRDQWAAELADRFGLVPTVVDATDARRRSAGLPVGVNPWATVPLAIASIDYVKRPEVEPSVQACRWDIVIVDEAHGVTPDTSRYGAVAAVCARAAYVLLLTATPHSGDHRAFLSLCGLGAQADDLLVFRRSRSEVAIGPRRRVHRVHVRRSAAERRVQEALGRFTRAVRAERGDHDEDARLVLAMLHKRAWSSAHSLERSVLRRLDELEGHPWPTAAEQMLLPLDGAGEDNVEDEPRGWTVTMLDDSERERWLLRAICQAAHEASLRETKLAALARLLARLARLGESAIVFTEFRDTLLHVRDRVAPAAVILHGGLSREERRTAIADFVKRRGVLLATDAAGEGLNLHESCRIVINLELPWNPMRLEQRIGRVDRIGQKRTVHAVHLIAADTDEARILMRLKDRIARARAEVGAPDPLGWLLDIDGAIIECEQHGGCDPRGRLGGPPASASVWSVKRLTAEAATEQGRLRLARRMANARGQPHVKQRTWDPSSEIGRDLWLAFSKRPGLRRLYCSSVFALFRTAVADPDARLVAAHLTPVLVRTAGRLTRAQADDLMRTLTTIVPEHLDPSLSSWTEDSMRLHRAFWSRRISREQAIARATAQAGASAFQVGLFDRRAERHHERETRSRDENRTESQERIVAAQRAGICEAMPSVPLLVLVV